MRGGDDLPALLAGLPELAAVLPALREAVGDAPAWLVGGAVRDALLGRPGAGLDLDVVVEADARAVALRLGALLGGRRVVRHDAFLTATVDVAGLPLDVVTARRERYARPGALPEVEPATIVDDLRRRDFTLNALAASLDVGAPGKLLDPLGGLPDLEAGVVRALHPASFADDATRILRGARYVARLGFALDPATARWARAAVAAGHVASVGPDRLRDALVLLLREEQATAALAVLADIGALRVLVPGAALDDRLRGALEDGVGAALRAGDAEPWRVRLGLLAAGADDPDGVVDGLRLARADAAAVRAAAGAPGLARLLARAADAGAIADLLDPLPAEAACAVVGAGPAAAAEAARRWLDALRHVRLRVRGDDLVAALGLPPGPEIGRLLAELRRCRLTGALADERSAQLDAARALADG